MPLEQAFLLKMVSMGLSSIRGMSLTMLKALETSTAFQASQRKFPRVIIAVYTDDGDLKDVIQSWRIAQMLNPFKSGPPGASCGAKARLVLEPWIVEAALARLGDRRLSPAEQQTVVEAMKSPRKVRWPEWWSVVTK